MTNQEIYTMCKRIAKRYRYHDEDELVHIGVMACLEKLHIKPDAIPVELYQAAKSAVWAEVNIGSLPVHISPNKKTISIARGEDTSSWDNYSSQHRELVERTLTSTKCELEYAENVGDNNSHSSLVEKETTDCFKKALNKLDKEYREVIQSLYYDGLTLQETGDLLGISKQAVYKKQCKALEILKEHLISLGVSSS